jgi:hypothetical protein
MERGRNGTVLANVDLGLTPHVSCPYAVMLRNAFVQVPNTQILDGMFCMLGDIYCTRLVLLSISIIPMMDLHP